MTLTPATNRQIPQDSFFDNNNKQSYLGNQYVYGINNLEITQTTEFPLLYLKNAAVAGSAFPSGNVALFVNLQRILAVTASQSAILKAYISPTITGNGTAKTPVNVRPASPNTSIASLFQAPTTSSNGTFIGSLGSNASAVSESKFLAIIDPGKSLLLTVTTSSNTTFIDATLGWYEL